MEVRRSIRVLFEEQRDTFTASSCREAKGNKFGHQFEDSFKRDSGASTAVISVVKSNCVCFTQCVL